ncbi:transglycosylase SLT domain-containing protein [Jannaschia sp. CCS1]|uniref:lytic transglycosylase domain-containing protein n=1 Tax=Jannaschia sp. (strain CCS1) TaxID=290400 RepID=UPI00006C0014|nr:transglycosylase SLT domain-containing protein [Jannaschia sp. CCS1]ABD54786.1 hypothetical protein Jann_1869 [Jannaschia sp. CCS1]
MNVLRFVLFFSGLTAVAAFAPGDALGQDDPLVEVTSGDLSGVLGPDLASDVLAGDVVDDGEVPGAVALLQVPREDDVRPDDLIPLEELPEISDLAPAISLRPHPRDTWAVPAARWDHDPRGAQWTAAVLAALRGPGAPLLQTEPRDIRAWCPGYLEASPSQRAAFWTGLVSTLAWHESTHNPRAVGGGGRWFGLVQIAPGTARWRDCEVGTGSALLDGSANLRCGIRIMGITVPRDNVVSEGMQGVAADWGPFHSSRKREDMRDWVREQDYCQAPPPQMRPVMRPERLAEVAPVAAAGSNRPVPRPTDL